MAGSIVIDGKKMAAAIKDQLAGEVRKMIKLGIDPPHLAAVIVGDDPASLTYVASKEKACLEVGFTSSVYKYPDTITEKELLDAVDFLNRDPDVDGFIVQLPIPQHINADVIIERIDPSKDVDGFHPVNAGRMMQGRSCFLPATPKGIMTMLEKEGIDTEGKQCVVLGRSNIVGTPVSILMSRKSKPGNATVTICHSKSENLEAICAGADIIIAAIGQPEFVKARMVKQGAVVIDVGIHRVEDASLPKGYRITGDVDYKNVAEKCAYISPVPGGVGPMTIVSLLQNTLQAAREKSNPSRL